MEENLQAIQSWVAQARSTGLSDDEISKQLRTSGWPESQISQFFSKKPQEVASPLQLSQDLVLLAKAAQHGGEIKTQPKRKLWLFRHLGLSIGVLAGILILGGVAFAGWQGYIPLPFLGNNAKLLTQAMQKLESVKSGEFGVTFTLVSEPRSPGATPLPKGTTNTADSLLPSEVTDGIPADLRLNGAFTAFMSTDSTDIQKLRGIFTAKGSYQSSGTTYNADLEARITAGQAYLFIKQFPSIPFVDLGSLTGKWIALNKPGDTTISDFLRSATPSDTNVQQETQKVKTEAAAMFRIALDTKALVLKNGGSERLDGHATKKIILTSNPDQWQAFLQAYRADAVTRKVPTDTIDEALKEVQNTESMAAMRAIMKNFSTTVWVDSADSTPRKAEISLIIVPDDTATKFKDKQIHFTIGFTLDHVNEQPNVEVPKDTIPLEEILGPLKSTPRSEVRNSQRKNDILYLRNALTLYYDQYNKFPKTIDEAAVKLSRLPVPPTADEKYVYTPTADFSSYTLCATLEDEGSGVKTYCRNSGGLTIETDVETENTPETTPTTNSNTNTNDTINHGGNLSNEAQRNEKRVADLYKLQQGVLLFKSYENRAPNSYAELLSHVPPVINDVTPIAGELYHYTLKNRTTGEFSMCAEFEDSTLSQDNAYEDGQYCIESSKPNTLIQKGVNGGVDIEHANVAWPSSTNLNTNSSN